ncbi:hypothetical protein EYF80_059090 [Liparis tanakae]|uniref:Uncharacterized protein n=1 Tax=Liparis tanakae TaxID=230148 RepID=A0A4Z2EPL2_9TELE|nr:hypothetical protein EYF80_059090 [Liparis tanakae]
MTSSEEMDNREFWSGKSRRSNPAGGKLVIRYQSLVGLHHPVHEVLLVSGQTGRRSLRPTGVNDTHNQNKDYDSFGLALHLGQKA